MNDILESFSAELKRSGKMSALAAITAEALAETFDDCEALRIYARIDALPEALLDILAADFGVKWYEYNGTLESKRAQIKSLFAVYRKLGTKQSVINAIIGLCDELNITEWYEYGGLPGHFKVVLRPKADFDFDKTLGLIRLVKRASAYLDATEILQTFAEPLSISIGAICSAEIQSSIVG